jgi:glycerol-3-phosphate acyltransferase PlsX
LKTTVWGWAAAVPMFFVQRPLKKKTDYAEVGGVPLLGLRHISIVAHGRSSPRAIKNALRAGEAAAAGGMAGMIAEEIALLHAAEQRLAERVTS